MTRILLAFALLAPTSALAFHCPLACDAVGGDVNGDGAVDIADLSVLGQYFSGATREVCAGGSDVNGDGAIDIADLSVLGSHLSGRGGAPADPACQYDRGDVNGDGGVDIGDVVAINGFLFAGTVDDICDVHADVNGDAGVDIADFSGLVSWLFGDGTAPAALCE